MDDDATRFEAIFRAHHRAVLGYALRRCDADTAQEVVADTFLVCWRRLEDVPPDASGEPGQVVTRRLTTYEKLPATPTNLELLDRP